MRLLLAAVATAAVTAWMVVDGFIDWTRPRWVYIACCALVVVAWALVLLMWVEKRRLDALRGLG